MTLRPQDGTLSILRRLNEAERSSVSIRIGLVTDTSPLTVAIGGDEDNPWAGVKVLSDAGRLEVDDIVACLVTQNDVLVLGRLGDGGGFQSAGPAGGDAGVTSASLAALGSGPSLTVQEGGSYAITFGMHMQTTGAGVGGLIGAVLIDGAGQGGTPNVSTDRLYFVSTATFGGATVEKTIVRTLDAGDVLTLARASQSGVAASFQEGYIQIRPAR